MPSPLTIEVEVRDYSSQQLLKTQSDPLDISLINSLRDTLDKHLGGMLCMSHFQLPSCATQYSRGRWVVTVTTCCRHHMTSVEKRLHEMYEQD
ncbi:MAG: hypothetical protein J7497_03250 [Chitinophagaceae bacterium]|nr:hypothetical protein [Chitinophagaceae bacterium]